MKTSAGLLSLALFLALPAAAQHAGSSGSSHGGGHASGGSSGHASAGSAGHASGGSSGHATGSYGSSGSYGGYSGHSSYASSSYVGAGSISAPQASGRYIGSVPAPRQSPIATRSFARAPFVGTQASRPVVPAVRTITPSQTAAQGPFITSVPRFQPGQGFFFGHGRHFHHGFHGSFFGSPFGCGFGSFNCFGGFLFDPLFAPVGLGYEYGLYSGPGYYGYAPPVPSPDAGNYYEAPSAPGTYMPDALSPAEPEEAPAPKLVTLLQLKDGTMYGITDYWLEGGQFHYQLSYGGGNAIPLERVDIPKTVELNSAKGMDFVLRSAPAAHPAPPPSILPLQPLDYPELMF